MISITHHSLDLEEFSAIATKSTSFQGLKFVCEPTKPVVDDNRGGSINADGGIVSEPFGVRGSGS